MSPIAATDLWRLSATELAEVIKRKQASSLEVLEAHLRRIEDVNPSINAVTVIMEKQAFELAKAADLALSGGGDVGPLHGVPFTVKANIDLVGAPTSQGLKALEAAYPTRDAPHVHRLKAAGAIPIGHTNMATIAVRWHCVSELWGATFNPWDRSRTPGASSGGDAAAVATGMTPLGIGSDGLGSLRWPAQCCGISALKPTLGRIPAATTIEPCDVPMGAQLEIVEGPMARKICDLRAAFNVMAGLDWRDPWSALAPLRGPDLAKPLRVALVIDPAGQGTVEQVKDGIRRAGVALEGAGYIVEEMEPPSILAAADTALAMLNTPEFHQGLEMRLSFLPEETRRFLEQFYEVAGNLDPATAMQSFITRQSLMRAWGEFQETYPLILAPIYCGLPFEAGSDLAEGRVAETIRGMRMAMAVNALGLPAVALPVGIAEGLPQSVQLIGRRYREDVCLDAAQTIENAFGVITPIDPK